MKNNILIKVKGYGKSYVPKMATIVDNKIKEHLEDQKKKNKHVIIQGNGEVIVGLFFLVMALYYTFMLLGEVVMWWGSLAY